MRHSKNFNHLGRTSSHRKSMLSNMATSLILHKRITTTTAKAKALRTFVEPIITKSKEDSTHSRRVVFSKLKDKSAVAELFREVSPKISERPGGYTRILKIGNRYGDNADMCILELVDYNEAMLGGDAAKTKPTRRRRSTKKKDEPKAEAKAPAAKIEEPEAVVETEAEVKTQAPVTEEKSTESDITEEPIEKVNKSQGDPEPEE
jgi:large subunit ribosomal protein L17